MPSGRHITTVRLRRIGAEMRKLRKAAGLTREDVVERTSMNMTTLYRIEYARVKPQPRSLRNLLDIYGVGREQQTELLTLLKESGQKSYLHTYTSELPETYATFISFEDEARSESYYQSLHVPGLLQTEGYARAVIRGTLPDASQDEVERRVEARMARQAVLTRADEDPLKFWAIVDEAALRRQVGGLAVMREQLATLHDANEIPNVTFQVIPFGAGAHPGMPGSFVVMRFLDPADPEVVYVDSMAGDLFLEEEVDIRRFTLAFEHLRAVALSPAASAALAAAIAGES